MLIKANQALFNAWTVLGSKVRSMAGLVGNDADISDLDLIEWRSMNAALVSQIEALSLLTYNYCKGNVNDDNRKENKDRSSGSVSQKESHEDRSGPVKGGAEVDESYLFQDGQSWE
jgi:hypothetical protein